LVAQRVAVDNSAPGGRHLRIVYYGEAPFREDTVFSFLHSASRSPVS
jgi:hypothetical protein